MNSRVIDTVADDCKIRLAMVPTSGRGHYGFADFVDGPPAQAKPHQQVFVHLVDIQAAGLPVSLAVGDEYVCRVVDTDKGFRAQNLRAA